MTGFDPVKMGNPLGSSSTKKQAPCELAETTQQPEPVHQHIVSSWRALCVLVVCIIAQPGFSQVGRLVQPVLLSTSLASAAEHYQSLTSSDTKVIGSL